MSNFKQDRQYITEQIREIINHYDPEGLDAGKPGGTPSHEYDPEVAPIAAFFIHNQEKIKVDHLKLVNEINRIWNEYFSYDCENAHQIAENIILKSM